MTAAAETAEAEQAVALVPEQLPLVLELLPLVPELLPLVPRTGAIPLLVPELLPLQVPGVLMDSWRFSSEDT